MDENARKELRSLLAAFDAGMLIPEDMTNNCPFPVLLGLVDRDGETIRLAVDAETARQGQCPPASTWTLACCHKAKHLALRGTVTFDFEEAAVRGAWTKRWSQWFPDEPRGKRVALIRFSACDGEYWDSTGLRQFTYVVQTARSLVRGARIAPRGEHHIKL